MDVNDGNSHPSPYSTPPAPATYAFPPHSDGLPIASPSWWGREPANIPHCFFIDQHWWLRLDITRVRDDITMKTRELTFLGAKPGWVTVATTLDHVFTLDNSGYENGSILHFLPILQKMRASYGDHIWLNPSEDGVMRIRRFLAKPDRPAFDAIARRCGILPVTHGDDLRRRLAAALALPSRASWEALAEHLITRGDQDLGELVSRYAASGCSPGLPQAPMSEKTPDAQGFNEFLALLREP